jgi:hypothetical protein
VASHCLQLGHRHHARFLFPIPLILCVEISTIVARFNPGVVVFLFHGRNSGQQNVKRRKGQGVESANRVRV